jgi:hypothetical protein
MEENIKSHEFYGTVEAGMKLVYIKARLLTSFISVLEVSL